MLLSALAKNGLIAIGVAGACFLAGYHYSSTTWENKFAEYQLSEKSRQEIERAEWQRRVDSANFVLADARVTESAANSQLNRLRLKVAELQRNAKDTESEKYARCSELAVRCGELLNRSRVAIEWCDKLTENK